MAILSGFQMDFVVVTKKADKGGGIELPSRPLRTKRKALWSSRPEEDGKDGSWAQSGMNVCSQLLGKPILPSIYGSKVDQLIQWFFDLGLNKTPM